MRTVPILALTLAAALTGCSGTRTAQGITQQPPVPATIVRHDGASRVIGAPPPGAIAYRTNGDYAALVPVNLTPEGMLLSYPAPSDLRNACPLPLADGYLLDRRGIGFNTVFTRYTYAEYSAMTQAPPPDSIIANIIPGSCVTQILPLRMGTAEAVADTAAVNAYILSTDMR